MDIQYLLFLQNLREATAGFLNDFFSFITTIAVDYYILLPMMILFWTVDKRKASRILITWGTSLTVGAFLKATFCVYRPWIRDPRVLPPQDIMNGATGYSFPSGHSFSAGGFWNGLAICYKENKALVVFCATMVLFTMFSRNYFGVHTPQDVLVGGCVSLICAFGISKLLDHMDEHPEKDWMLVAAVTLLMVALLFYIKNKSYPEDYVNGVLLVDPKKMTVDGFKDPARLYGIILGWFIERRWIRFDVNGTVQQRIMRSLVGALLVLFWWVAVVNPVGKMLNIGLAHFVLQATVPLLFMTVYPLVFKAIEGRAVAVLQKN